MADKAAPAKPPDLTWLFVVMIIMIVAGLGSIRSCGPADPGSGCTNKPPTQAPVPNGRPIPVTPNLKHYTVQVGSFKTREQASGLAAELRSRNINNFILQADGQYLVCVGKFVSAPLAAKMVNTLKGYGYEEVAVLSPQKKTKTQ
jgi:cell division protein FtsN